MKKKQQASYSSTFSPAYGAKLEEFEFPSAGLFSVGVSHDTGNVELTFIPAFDHRALLTVSLPKGSLGSLLLELRSSLSVIGRGLESTDSEMQPLVVSGASIAVNALTHEDIVVLDFEDFETRMKIPNAQVAAEFLSVLQRCANTIPPAA